jgi:ribonuclease HI
MVCLWQPFFIQKKKPKKKTPTAHRAPTTHMATAFGGRMTGLEVIDAFTMAPWESDTRSAVLITEDWEVSAKQSTEAQGNELQMFTDASQRNGLTGYSVVVWMEGQVRTRRQRTIGIGDQVTVHTAELAAIMEAVDWAAFALTRSATWRSATVYSDSKAALQTVANFRQRSGQRMVRRVHEVIRDSRLQGHDIRIAWVPGHYNIAGNEKAHQLALETTTLGKTVTPVPWLDVVCKSAALRQPPETRGKNRIDRPWKTGKHLRQVDAALPGTHVRRLYDTLTRQEAQVLAQLRTGLSRLRGFLAKLGLKTAQRANVAKGWRRCATSSSTALASKICERK